MRFLLIFILLCILFQDAFRRVALHVLAPLIVHGRSEWLESTRVCDYIKPGAKVLDFGTGTGSLACMLQTRGADVTPLDVSSACFLGDPAQVVVYDGVKIPYPDATFDVGIACTVLHHIPDPDASLRELLRVCKRVIIVEDVPTGPLHAFVIHCLDSLSNWEFLGHPHSNKTDAEWRRAFLRQGAALDHCARLGGVFGHVMYVLTPKPNI